MPAETAVKIGFKKSFWKANDRAADPGILFN